jgi:glycerol uptake facilitator-like aquaporin
MSIDLARRGTGELVGTALLVGAAMGGGKAAAATGSPPYMALVIGTLAAAATLLTVLYAIGPLTGGHINPAVTVSMVVTGKMALDEGAVYVVSQLIGGFIGAMAANAIWQEQLVVGAGSGTLNAQAYAAEVIATCGLVGAIHASVRGGNAHRLPLVVPAAVVAGSLAAPFGMANPAVALAAGVIGGGLGVASIVPLVLLELVFAGLIAIGVGLLYGGVDASELAGPKAFEVRLDPYLDIELRAHVIASVKTALRPQDIVVCDDQQCRIVLEEATEDVVEVVRRRIETVIAFSTAEHQIRNVEFDLVPLAIGG